MSVRLKTKVSLGVSFLFALLLLVGGTTFFFFNTIHSRQENILKDNYKSISYARNMLLFIDSANIAQFEQALAAQEMNITEPGEKEATLLLRRDFGVYKQHPDSAKSANTIREDINRIMQINLSAILQKNEDARRRSKEAVLIITVLLTISALLGFVFVFNFPGYIADPIARLTKGIKAVAGKKYDQHIHLNRRDEFGEMADAFNYMADELNRYEHSNLAKILFEKQRAETVINSLKDASIGIGLNGTILFANKQSLQLLSLDETDVVGKKQQALAAQNDLFRFLVEEQGSQPFKIVVNGKEEFFSKENIDISNTDGPIGYMLVLKNITPYKELDVAKTNFIATVSHELKTPLASSDFSLKLLEDERVGALNAEQKELVRNIKEDNHRLLKILSELLDLSQVESGRIQLNLTAVDVSAAVQNAVAATHAAAAQKNIQVVTNLDADAHLVADQEKIAWVMINFLTNAIKYSPSNSQVLVNIRKENQQFIFEVIDNGTGIGSEYLPKLFNRFYQVPGTEKNGNGLGLSISKEFIEAMGGEIGVESEIGKGSRFYFKMAGK